MHLHRLSTQNLIFYIGPFEKVITIPHWSEVIIHKLSVEGIQREVIIMLQVSLLGKH